MITAYQVAKLNAAKGLMAARAEIIGIISLSCWSVEESRQLSDITSQLDMIFNKVIPANGDDHVKCKRS
jgi:hypothetical protein